MKYTIQLVKVPRSVNLMAYEMVPEIFVLCLFYFRTTVNHHLAPPSGRMFYFSNKQANPSKCGNFNHRGQDLIFIL